MDFYLIVGHSAQSQGARFLDTEWSEYNYNLTLARATSCHMGLMGHSGFILTKDDLSNKEIAEMIDYQKPCAAVEFHCNAFNEEDHHVQKIK